MSNETAIHMALARVSGQCTLVSGPNPPGVALTWWKNRYDTLGRSGNGIQWYGTLKAMADWLDEYTQRAVHTSDPYGRRFAHGTSDGGGRLDAECTSITCMFADNDDKDDPDVLMGVLRDAGIGFIVQIRNGKWHLHIALTKPLIPTGENWKREHYMPEYGWLLGVLAELGKHVGAKQKGFDVATDQLLNACFVRHRVRAEDPVPVTIYEPGLALDWDETLKITGYKRTEKTAKKRVNRINYNLGAGVVIGRDDDRLFRAFDAAGLIRGVRPRGGYFVTCPWLHQHTGRVQNDTSSFIDHSFYCAHATCKKNHSFMDLKYDLPKAASDILFGVEETTVVETVPTVLPKDMRTELLARFVKPNAGVYIVHAETGIGKTQAFVDIGIKRAQAQFKTKKAREQHKNRCHADHSTTVILVPTHAIATQLYKSFIAQLFFSVRYIRSILAVPEPDQCAMAVQLRPLVNGGQLGVKVGCLDGGAGRCSHWDGCKARESTVVGDPRGHVTICVHANLPAVLELITRTTLVVLDESHSPIRTVSWDLPELDHAIAELPAFEDRYVARMRPILDKFRLDLKAATDAEITSDTPFRGLRDWCGAGLIEQAVPLDAPPPINRQNLSRAFRSAEHARRVGVTSSALSALDKSLVLCARDVAGHALSPVVRISSEQGHVRLSLTYPDVYFVRMVAESPTLVYLDANADLHRGVYESLTGPLTDGERYLRYPCADGAPISRVLVNVKCTRGIITPHPVGLCMEKAMKYLEIMRDRIVETRCERVGLITYKALAVAMNACMSQRGMEDEDVDEIDTVPEGHLQQTIAFRLREFLDSCKVPIIVGWYGNTRGSDQWLHCDHLITIGDPRPNVGHQAFTRAYLGPQGPGEDSAARAELEQAHGRLRTPHRTVAGHATHIGQIVPSGTGWTTHAHRFVT